MALLSPPPPCSCSWCPSWTVSTKPCPRSCGRMWRSALSLRIWTSSCWPWMRSVTVGSSWSRIRPRLWIASLFGRTTFLLASKLSLRYARLYPYSRILLYSHCRIWQGSTALRSLHCQAAQFVSFLTLPTLIARTFVSFYLTLLAQLYIEKVQTYRMQ